MLISRLSKRKIKTLPDGLHCDGRNLYLQVRGGSASWLFRYKRGGKIRTVGLGPLRLVPLEEARKKADELNRELQENGEVQAQRRPKTVLFRDIAETAIDRHIKMARITAPRYKYLTMGMLRKHVFPSLGDSPISTITSKQLADTLLPVWDCTIGSNALKAIRLVFKYAATSGLVKPPFPCEWNGVLSTLLPRPFSSKTHFSFVPWTDIPKVYKKIYDAADCVPRRASLLAILLVPRISELLSMKSSDYDAKHRTLRIAKTKTNTGEFLIPLPRQAVELVPDIDGALFPSPRARKSNINSQAVRKFLTNLGIDGTTHGFRASFSTWCADNEKDTELRERCLQHAYGSKVTAAYQRSDLLERRRKLLQEWADYVTSRTPS